MKFIEPCFRVQPNYALNPCEKLESIGRVCYRSEDKITDGSCGKFVENLIKRGHFSILEHVNFNFKIQGTPSRKFLLLLGNYQGITITQVSNVLNVNMNLRNAVELADFDGYSEFLKLICINEKCLLSCFKNTRPEIFTDSQDVTTFMYRDKMKITFVPFKKVVKTDNTIFYTVFFQIPRGIWDELARHRKNACACESSRYCLYSKDKFDGQITFNKPIWWDEKGTICHTVWNLTFWIIEKSYLFLTKFLPAQFARGVLPLDYSVKCCVTASLEQWKHILKLRTSEGAHPEMRKIMLNLQKALNITDDELKSPNLK